jgi:hypothetical protein
MIYFQSTNNTVNWLKKCYQFNRLYSNYSPCINLLKWGVYYPPSNKPKLTPIMKKVKNIKTNSGFYALYMRGTTVNDKKTY